MKYTLPLLTFLLLGLAPLHADDQTRNVQMMLKNEGFYYGEIDGRSGSELSAAIRRYQIRNGLEVTGALNPETLGALGIGGAKSAPHPAAQDSTPPAPAVMKTPPAPTDTQLAPPPAEPKPKAPINLRRGDDDGAGPSTGGFRAPDETMPPRPRRDPGAIPPPAPLDERNPLAPEPGSGGGFAQIFAGTPYASAPRQVQESTVRRAQQIFATRGFYRDAIDGRPSPATEEAVLSYQRSAHLPLSGRLDLQTLSILHLLPGAGRPSGVPLKPFNGSAEGDGVPVPSRPGPVYRGVWVQ